MRRSLALVALALVACGPGEHPGTAAPAPSRSAATTTSSAAPRAWRRLADIPTPRSEVAAAVYQQDKVYVIGGVGAPDRVGSYEAAAHRRGRVAHPPPRVDHAESPAGLRLPTRGGEGVYGFAGGAGGAAPRGCPVRG